MLRGILSLIFNTTDSKTPMIFLFVFKIKKSIPYEMDFFFLNNLFACRGSLLYFNKLLLPLPRSAHAERPVPMPAIHLHRDTR